ncbi:MAG TPA: GNAT family N-acetyltransferase [Anaerolineae bacterium]|jgi:ribosomal protein S18 acetylase RimI-like enzyme|nr:GNAT family N-acetyltransferase [Anaerolineae bacterium]
MEYQLKRITKFDTQLIDELTLIEEEAFDDGGLNRWTFPVVVRHGMVYVVECDGTICGIADIIKDWFNPQLAFIINFVVRKEYRGRGLGFMFLSAIIKRLQDNGVKWVQLTVSSENSQAIGLYRKAGFKQVAELPDEYGPTADRLLYELELEG